MPTSPTPGASTPTSVTSICSRLDFSDVVWPEGLTAFEERATALALNITGSFEGSGGWSTIAGNFDGQGMSLGLSQQNFGQGTLQPLLITMVQKERKLTQNLFTASNFDSMTRMLEKWSGRSIASAMGIEEISKIAIQEKPREEDLFPKTEALNELDEGFVKSDITAFGSGNASSVAWASANLFTVPGGSTFKADWKQSFKSLSATAPYRSLQVKAAMSMFAKANGYFKTLRFTQIRSLLLLYDFVVQNGGFNSEHLAKFRAFDAANPQATEGTRLLKLLEIRLVSVRAQYRGDVNSRKTTIIMGTGTVHGVARNLPKEYCFARAETAATVGLIQP